MLGPRSLGTGIGWVGLAALFLAGCEPLPVASQAVNVGSTSPLPAVTQRFRYALVSPASSRDAQPWAEVELVRHGYTVIPAYAANSVLRARPVPDILVVECYDIGSSFVVIGTTRKVRCLAVALRDGERLFEGRGEAIGKDIIEDFRGATRAALDKLPVTADGRGRLLTLGEVPAAIASASAATAPRAAQAAPSEPRMASGSGFVVTESGHVVTNAHVVEDCKNLTGRVGAAEQPLQVLATDAANDLALLSLPQGRYSSVRLRLSSAPRLGEPVTVIGFPLQDRLASSTNVTSGNISALAGLANDVSHFQLTAPVQPGNSGGPVVDDQGALVGVVVAKLSDRLMAREGQVAQNVNFAIKGSVAALFLDTHGVSYRAAEGRPAPGPTVIAAEASAYTVRITCTL